MEIWDSAGLTDAEKEQAWKMQEGRNIFGGRVTLPAFDPERARAGAKAIMAEGGIQPTDMPKTQGTESIIEKHPKTGVEYANLSKIVSPDIRQAKIDIPREGDAFNKLTPASLLIPASTIGMAAGDLFNKLSNYGNNETIQASLPKDFEQSQKRLPSAPAASGSRDAVESRPYEILPFNGKVIDQKMIDDYISGKATVKRQPLDTGANFGVTGKTVPNINRMTADTLPANNMSPGIKEFGFSKYVTGLQGKIQDMMRQPRLYAKELKVAVPLLNSMMKSEIEAHLANAYPDIYGKQLDYKAKIKQLEQSGALTSANVRHLMAQANKEDRIAGALPANLAESKELEQAKHPKTDKNAQILASVAQFGGMFKDAITGEFNQKAFDGALPGFLDTIKKHGLLSDDVNGGKTKPTWKQFLSESMKRNPKLSSKDTSALMEFYLNKYGG
jgi:hypothetical protein